MNFNEHSELEGKHAILGASNYHWLNYNDAQLIEKLKRKWAPTIGTLLHQYVADEHILNLEPMRRRDWPNIEKYLVDEGIPSFVIDKKAYFDTIYRYTNDCVRYKMKPEVVLSYSEYLFGTADGIRFYNNYLRIFDLKTGTGKVSMKQLYIYAAIFCLEYEIDPRDIHMDLRIYQNGDKISESPKPKEILEVMDVAVRFNNKILEMEKRS